jgi:hypothetical protein
LYIGKKCRSDAKKYKKKGNKEIKLGVKKKPYNKRRNKNKS